MLAMGLSPFQIPPHGGQHPQELLPELRGIFHPEGPIPIANPSIWRAKAEGLFHQQTIGHQLHHMGRVRMRGSRRGFHFHRKDRLPSPDQIIRPADQAIT